MNENIDLTKILDGCPKGTKFYSSVYEEVLFIGLDSSFERPIEMIDEICKELRLFTKEGRAFSGRGECTLFPSKDQRDWSKFERFWDKPKIEKFDPNTLQPFDMVLVRDNPLSKWRPDFFGFPIQNENYIICASSFWYQCIPYNDDTKHLLGTNNDCPEYYKWWKK